MKKISVIMMLLLWVSQLVHAQKEQFNPVQTG